MKYACYLILLFLVSCKTNNAPDVSAIKVNLQTERFDNDFFGIDTNHIFASIEQLQRKYPGFTAGFMSNIMGLQPDSLSFANSQTDNAIRQFIRDYKPVRDSCLLLFKDFEKWNNEIKKALKYVKYYFPDYKLPQRVITFIGPMDAYFTTSFGIQGDVLTPAGIGIGLQLHLGSNFSFYQSEQGQELYPEYLSRTFDPQHIPINAMKVIVDDLYPGTNQSMSLVEQMVESGRRYFLLTKFMPEEKESNLFGYTKDQMDATYKNEAVIWDFFLNNNLLNNSDPNIVKNYIGPSPKTQVFGDGSPGNLGSFAGLQIVKKFMDKNPEISLQQLMQIPLRQIYERSKYKPKD